MRHITIGSMMDSGVVAVSPDCPAREVVALMAERRLSCVVVCDGPRPIGVLSERDLVRVLHEASRSDVDPPATAFDVMSFPPFTLREIDSVKDAMTLLSERAVRRAPVVDIDGRLIGLVTQGDLLAVHAHEMERHGWELERVVAERTQELRRANERLKTLAFEDALLGIGNRRAMWIALEEIHEVALRYRRPYSVVLLDVDHFKAYNDRYGHLEGDRILQSVAHSVESAVRSADQLYRYGGEELVMLLPETSASGAERAAERARAGVERLAIEHTGAPIGVVTVSAGVAAAVPDAGLSGDWRGVVAEADSALYRAKAEGRNRVCVASSSEGGGSERERRIGGSLDPSTQIRIGSST